MCDRHQNIDRHQKIDVSELLYSPLEDSKKDICLALISRPWYSGLDPNTLGLDSDPNLTLLVSELVADGIVECIPANELSLRFVSENQPMIEQLTASARSGETLSRENQIKYNDYLIHRARAYSDDTGLRYHLADQGLHEALLTKYSI